MKNPLTVVVLIAILLMALLIVPNTSAEISSILGISRDIAITTQIPDSKEYPCYKVVYDENEKWSKPELMKPKENLPSEEEAIEIASQYIINNGGFPEGAYLDDVESVHIWSVNKITDKVIKMKPINIDITYSRLIDGKQVFGPGDKISVSIGEDGEILYYFRSWRHLEKAENKKMISVYEAVEKLKRGEIIERSMKDSGTFEIKQISVGYYAEEEGIDQEFYEPVWVFEGVDMNGNDAFRVVKGVSE